MTAFEVPIYPEESPDIGTPVTSTPVETSKEFEQAMRGVRALIIPTICTGIETCKDSSHE